MDIKKDINNIHDKSYKDFFSNSKIFVDLISNFIDNNWAKNIKTQDLELVNKSFILSNYEEIESDIVYKVKNDKEEIYFYILLELQSTVDFSMPIRLYFYISEIYREIIKNKTKSVIKGKNFKLPAVVPIVLYNGEKKWTAEREFKNIVFNNEIFHKNIINFEYLLLDVNRYNKDELMKIGSISAAIFMLDQKVHYIEFVNRLKEIVLTFDKLTENDKMKLRNWLRNIIDERFKAKFKIDEIITAKKQEVEKMTSNISRTLMEEYERNKREGREEGVREGLKEGREEGLKEGILLTKKVLKLSMEGLTIYEIAKLCEITEENVKDILE